MESVDFKKILFETAFCVMACDGHIDQSEVEEMEKIDKNLLRYLTVKVKKLDLETD